MKITKQENFDLYCLDYIISVLCPGINMEALFYQVSAALVDRSKMQKIDYSFAYKYDMYDRIHMWPAPKLFVFWFSEVRLITLKSNHEVQTVGNEQDQINFQQNWIHLHEPTQLHCSHQTVPTTRKEGQPNFLFKRSSYNKPKRLKSSETDPKENCMVVNWAW